MSKLSDDQRLRELLDRLAEVQRESEFLREKIRSIERSTPEWPNHRRGEWALEPPWRSDE